MKPSKKLKVDQVITSLLLDDEDDNDLENDSFSDESFKTVENSFKINKTPLKSIEKRINFESKKVQKENKIDKDDDDDEDDDLPLSKLIIKKSTQNTSKMNSNSNGEEESDDDEEEEEFNSDDSEEDDLPLSALVAKKNIHSNKKLENLRQKLKDLDLKYDKKNLSTSENNSCVFLKGIYEQNNDLSCFNLNQNENFDLSYLEDSDFEELDPKDEQTSPIIKLETNFFLSIKNIKRKSFI